MAQITISSPDGVLNVSGSGTSSITLTLTPPTPPAPVIAPKPLKLIDAIGYIPNDGKAYDLVSSASDEFNTAGTPLDTTKWWTRHKDNGGKLDYYNDELQRYVDNHVVSGGTLKLSSKVRTTTLTSPVTGKIYPMFDSSMVRSRTLFKYGYAEMRAKVPPGLGVWPAFWILSQSGASQVCEIDVMEYVMNGKTELPNMVHVGLLHNCAEGPIVWQSPNYKAQYGIWRMSAPVAGAYHVYSVLWEEGLITWYVDGQPIVQRRCDWKAKDGSDGGMASLIANLAMGGSWATAAGTTNVATDPQVFEIGHIRLYQVKGQEITGVSPV